MFKKSKGPEMVAQMSHLPSTKKNGNTEKVPTVKPIQPVASGTNKVKGSGDEGKGSVGSNKLSTSVMSRYAK